jgi:SAM-dependent methyltransferase
MSADLDVWRAGLGIGFRALRREPSLGLKRLLLPVSYWRYAEFSYVARQLALPTGARVLDLGSPKDLAAMLAHGRGYAVVATDILDSAVRLSARYCAALGIAGDGAGLVRSEVVDGRRLPYADDSFEAAFSVSVVEHIPDGGDRDAMQELARVVRPGGLIVVTTPYAPIYRETFVDRPVYERAQHSVGEPVFYERHYDDAALHARLIDLAGTELVNLERWGEGAIRMERLLSRAGPIRTAASPLEPLLASRCLRCVDGDDGGHPMAAFFTLRCVPA